MKKTFSKISISVFAIFILFIMVIVIMGCPKNINPYEIKDPYSRARFVTVTYNYAFKDHQRVTSFTNLTPEAKKILNAKYYTLTNLHIGVSVFNGRAETGTITDAMFKELLDRLFQLESGWYTESTQAFISQAINDQRARQLAYEAGLMDEGTSAQFSPIFGPVLLELIKLGLHSYRAIQGQRNLDAAQMKAAWQTAYDEFKTLDVNSLKRVSAPNTGCLKLAAGHIGLIPSFFR